MKQLIFLIAFALFFTISATAQKGNNGLELVAEVALPGEPNKVGFGGSVKAKYGIGRSAQLTLATGVSKFSSRYSYHPKTTTRLIPVLVGLRKNVSKMYLEPQVGYGELGGKVSFEGDYSRPSIGAFFWAATAGYNSRILNVGIRYQSAHGAESRSAGTWHNKNFRYLGFFVGLNIFGGAKN